MEESVSRSQLVGSTFWKEMDVPKALQLEDGCGQGLDVHGKDEAMGSRKLEVIEKMESTGSVPDIIGKGYEDISSVGHKQAESLPFWDCLVCEY